MDKNGQMVRAAMPQPTLPTFEVDLFADEGKGLKKGGAGVGNKGGLSSKRSSINSSAGGTSPAFGAVRFPGAPPPPPGASIPVGLDTSASGLYLHADDNMSRAPLMAYPGPAGSTTSLSPDAPPQHVRGLTGPSGSFSSLPGVGAGPAMARPPQAAGQHAHLLAEAGLDFPPPPGPSSSVGLDYPPPDLSVYMPYQEDQYAPIPAHHMQQQQQLTLPQNFGSQSQLSHQTSQHWQPLPSPSGQEFVLEDVPGPRSYQPPPSVEVEREGEGGFFEQLGRAQNRNSERAQQQLPQYQHAMGPGLHAAARPDSTIHLRDSVGLPPSYQSARHLGVVSASQSHSSLVAGDSSVGHGDYGSRGHSMNFEDIYAQYEEPAPSQSHSQQHPYQHQQQQYQGPYHQQQHSWRAQ